MNGKFFMNIRNCTWSLNVKCATWEAFSNIVEGLAGVCSSVLGEYLLNFKSIDISSLTDIVEIFAGLDFLLVMQPDNVKVWSSSDGTLQPNWLAVVHNQWFDVLVYSRWGTGCMRWCSVRSSWGCGDFDGGRRLHTTLGVGCLACVTAGIFRIDLIDCQGCNSIFVFDLDDVIWVQLLAIFCPDNLDQSSDLK